MPVVQAHVLEGYSPQEKSRLTTALTQAIRFVVPAPDEAITVMVHEVAPEAYARGGAHRAPAPALPDPGALVLDYLKHMEARDLDAARAMLGDGFEMVFPGTAPMTTLEELIDWAKPRYQFVTKSYEATEAFQGEHSAAVYTRGTLSGAWPDGTAFEGIRFIDRFEVRNGKITRQDVWNDIAEVRPK
ncbi:MAG: nuclear transport factor 2 family protein [Silicimonas sp.]|nr:nuclear transport factor 2 family protein [Silicimonas sp.]